MAVEGNVRQWGSYVVRGRAARALCRMQMHGHVARRQETGSDTALPQCSHTEGQALLGGQGSAPPRATTRSASFEWATRRHQLSACRRRGSRRGALLLAALARRQPQRLSASTHSRLCALLSAPHSSHRLLQGSAFLMGLEAAGHARAS